MSSNRLHHLDFLRASMMFMGVLVHASHADYDVGNYEFIRDASGFFRMACFFIISGFFSAMVLQRTSLTSFLKKRIVMLGVPATLCVLLLVPVANSWMQAYFREGGTQNEFVTSWMAHAWFLFVLLIYTPLLLPMIGFVKASTRMLSKIMPAAWAQLVFLLVAACFAMVAKKMVQKFGPVLPHYEEWKFLASTTIGYLPHFLLGIGMFLWKDVYNKLHSWPLAWTALATALVIAKIYYIGEVEITSTLQHIKLMALDYTISIAISAALFASALRLIKEENRLVRLMSESAYTVYIVHYLIIAVVLLELQRLDIAMPFRMLTAFAAASVLGVALHVYVVKRQPLAALLLNGRLTKIQDIEPKATKT